MRERRGDEGDEEIRQRLHELWPQARPLPDEDVEQWGLRDSQPAAGPPAGRSALGSFDPGRRGVRALALVAVLVVLAAGYLAWRAQPRSEPVPAAPAPVAPAAPATGTGTGTSVVVAVAGRVRHPGLVRLPAGARVQDAIEAAGGALPGTDLAFVNLARRVVDGELLVVGVSPPPGLGTGGAAGNPAAGTGLVNLNTATLAELDALPGIGPALAQRIVDYRTAHGGFRSVDELRRVEGIGDAKFAQLKDRVAV
ncbi:MAG: competence protein ComEA [Micromonosporaceae bacterium]